MPAPSTSAFESWNDIDLVRRLKLRSVAATEELYDRYGRLLYTLLLNVVGDAKLAEDLLCEVFLKACNLIHDLPDGNAALAPWLLFLTRNHALDYQRELACLPENPTRSLALQLPTLYRNSNFDCGYLARERDVFLRLDQEQRLTLELAWFEMLTFDQIAYKMERPVPFVISAAETALKQLRDAGEIR